MSFENTNCEYQTILEAFLSSSANVFKNLIELLSQVAPIKKNDNAKKSIKQAFFKISKDGICINIDPQNDILINVMLDADKFCSYKYSSEQQELNIGITLDVIKDTFKNVKKSEGVAIRIVRNVDDIVPTEIGFTFSSENNSSRGFVVKFNVVPNICVNAAIDGQELVQIKSTQFQGLCKDMGGSKRQVKVAINNNAVVFSCNMVDIAVKWLSFPICDDKEDDEKFSFVHLFKSEYIKTISKLATFDDVIKMSCIGSNSGEEDSFIIFRSNITRCTSVKLKNLFSNIGSITVWVKAEPRKDVSDEDEL